LEKLVREKIKFVTEDDWAGCHQHVRTNRKSILHKRHITDNTGDTFTINSGNNDSSIDDSSDGDSDNGSDRNDDDVE
jgi:phage anti-repressor protein